MRTYTHDTVPARDVSQSPHIQRFSNIVPWAPPDVLCSWRGRRGRLPADQCRRGLNSTGRSRRRNLLQRVLSAASRRFSPRNRPGIEAAHSVAMLGPLWRQLVWKQLGPPSNIFYHPEVMRPFFAPSEAKFDLVACDPRTRAVSANPHSRKRRIGPPAWLDVTLPVRKGGPQSA